MGGEYLIDILFEVGPGKASPFGLEPLGATDLMAWQQGVGHTLQGWEFSTLIELSRVFVASARKYEGSNDLAPGLTEYEKGMQIKHSMSGRVGKPSNG